MQDRDDDTTIGKGGWGLVVASGLIVFFVLRGLFDYLLFPSLAFALAIALVVLLVLHRLAVAVTRHEAAEAGRPVRRIVPASALSEGTTRVSGIEGAQASPVVAVPVRPEPSTPKPQRPTTTVTPLVKLDPAPIILAPQSEAPPSRPSHTEATVAPGTPAPAARVADVPPVPPTPAAAAPAAEARTEAVSTAGPAKAVAEAGAKAAPGRKSVAKPAAPKATVGFKGKAELEAQTATQEKASGAAEAAGGGRAAKPRAAAKPKATTRSGAAKSGAAKSGAAKSGATGKSKAAEPAPSGLVRLSAPRNGKADDLKLIDGVGPALEKLINSLGFYHFDQIAAWTEADIALVDAELKSFKGRATRDKWVLQAKILANGGTVEEAAAAAKA